MDIVDISSQPWFIPGVHSPSRPMSGVGENYWNKHGVFGMNDLACGCGGPSTLSIIAEGLFVGSMMAISYAIVKQTALKATGSNAAAIGLGALAAYGGWKVTR